MRQPSTRETSAIIVAGGPSRRMGRCKALVEVAGRPLLARVLGAAAPLVEEIVLVLGASGTRPPAEEEALVALARATAAEAPAGTPPVIVRVARDLVEAQGPLSGLVSGLAATTASRALVLASDAPALEPPLLRLVLNELDGQPQMDAVLPLRDGHLEPLVAAYRPARAMAPLRRALDGGERALHRALATLAWHPLEESVWRAVDPGGLSFVNLNSPEDLAAFEGATRR